MSNNSQYQIHELADVFPLMSEDEYTRLLEDIRENGQLETIKTYKGEIIDGRNRLKACIELGIEPKTEEWSGQGSLVRYVIGLNYARRHLTTTQKALVAHELEEHLAKEAKDRQGSRTDLSENLPENFPGSYGEAREIAGNLVGVNAHYVSDVKKLKETSPDVYQLLYDNTITISQAKAISKLPSEAKEIIFQAADKSQHSIKKILKSFSAKPDTAKNEPELEDNNYSDSSDWHPFKGQGEANDWVREKLKENSDFLNFLKGMVLNLASQV